MKFYLITFILLILSSCKWGKQDLSTLELNELILQIHESASNDGTNCKIIDRMIWLDQSLNIIDDNKETFEKYFSEQDIEYIRSQNAKPNIFKLDSSMMHPYKLASGDSVHAVYQDDELIDGVYKNFGRLCHYGPLLFSLDRKKVLVNCSMSCGIICGEGYYVIFEFENGKWVKKVEFDHWVS